MFVILDLHQRAFTVGNTCVCVCPAVCNECILTCALNTHGASMTCPHLIGLYSQHPHPNHL